jgi:hypothetical protein
MLDEATVDSFRTISPVSPAHGSDLLHSDPIPELQASEFLRSPVTALRLAQIWEKAHNQNLNRYGIEFRNAFYRQLDHLIVPSFGDYPNPWCPEVTILRAVDWFLAVLARLQRRWREAKHDLAVWERMYPRAAKAIEHAIVHETVLHVVGSANCREEPFPWDHRNKASSRTVPRGSVLGVELLSKLEKQQSIRHAAETASYLLFREFLFRESLDGSKTTYCKYCDGIFLLTGNKKQFCSVACLRDFAKGEEYRRLYLKRVDVTIDALVTWRHRPRHNVDCRAYLEERLFQEKGCVEKSNSRKYQFVGAWIHAAFSRPRRRRLSELNDSCAKLTLHWHKTSGRPRFINAA